MKDNEIVIIGAGLAIAAGLAYLATREVTETASGSKTAAAVGSAVDKTIITAGNTARSTISGITADLTKAAAAVAGNAFNIDIMPVRNPKKTVISENYAQIAADSAVAGFLGALPPGSTYAASILARLF